MGHYLLKGLKEGSWRGQTGDNFSIYDADDPMFSFTSTMKDIAEETIPMTSAVQQTMCF